MIDTLQNILILLLFILYLGRPGGRIIHTEMSAKEFKEFLREKMEREEAEVKHEINDTSML